MKVAISVNGRFHAFDLARELNTHGVLYQLVTTYPRFITRKYLIPDHMVTVLLFREIIARTYKVFLKHYPTCIWLNNLYDFIASILIKNNCQRTHGI